MKKIIALLLSGLLCFSLCACGNDSNSTNEDPTKEKTKLIETTPDLDLDSMWLTAEGNQALATQTYNKRMYKVKVTVMNISNNYFEYSYRDNFGRIRRIQVYMPTEILATLKNGAHITVLGEFSLLSSISAQITDAFVVDSSNIGEKSFDEATIQEAIANFKPFNSKGNIDWNAGSAPFFVDNRLYFKELTEENFLDVMKGEWYAKQYVTSRRSEYKIIFTSVSTADVSENDGDVYEWTYRLNGNSIKFPSGAGKFYEARMVSDNLVVFYADTIDYVPYWILYKK